MIGGNSGSTGACTAAGGSAGTSVLGFTSVSGVVFAGFAVSTGGVLGCGAGVTGVAGRGVAVVCGVGTSIGSATLLAPAVGDFTTASGLISIGGVATGSSTGVAGGGVFFVAGALL